MKLNIRPLTVEEQKYTYDQSTQLKSRTGSIGRLRGDLGSDGMGFWSTWEDHCPQWSCPQWKTDEFKAEFDDVINALRSEEYGLLKNRRSMANFAQAEPDSAFEGNYTTEYGFRIDTEAHAFLLRCNPQQGDYNFYCFCYISKWLDQHIEAARKDIRFIDSDYNDLFRLPDGEKIVITRPSGAEMERTCRYIDAYHLEVDGRDTYHICEFAERMERVGNTYAPKEPTLPPECFAVHPLTGEAIGIVRYEKGSYWPIDKSADFVDKANKRKGVTKAQQAAMLAGAMFGWNVPAARPKNYDENGNFINRKGK